LLFISIQKHKETLIKCLEDALEILGYGNRDAIASEIFGTEKARKARPRKSIIGNAACFEWSTFTLHSSGRMMELARPTVKGVSAGMREGSTSLSQFYCSR
jgi:hypothetical protein